MIKKRFIAAGLAASFSLTPTYALAAPAELTVKEVTNIKTKDEVLLKEKSNVSVELIEDLSVRSPKSLSTLNDVTEPQRITVPQLSLIVETVEAVAEAVSQSSVTSSSSTNVPVSDTGVAVVDAALSRIGSPYVWGATGPDSFDCSGLTSWAFAQAGKSIPRTSQAQISSGTPVSLDNLQPGDLIGYYSGVTHVAMYIGNGQVVHASTYGVPVGIDDLHHAPISGMVRY